MTTLTKEQTLVEEISMGPLHYAQSTPYELIPGMRQQGKGLKIYNASDYAPLKAAIVGNPCSIFIPDPDEPEMNNLLADSAGKPGFMEFLREHKGEHLAATLPEYYEKMKNESDALAKSYRDNGVRLIRNETYTLPKALVEWQVPVTGDRFLSLYGHSGSDVYGNCFVSFWEVGAVRGTEMQHRDAILEIFENDPEAIWLSMPLPAPTSIQRSPQPFLSPGDPRIMPNKLVIMGIGVTDPAYINDPTKPRSSGFELGVEMFRRMMEPFGWRVETVYFNSRYTYHIDCLMMQISEGIYGLPKMNDKLGPVLWTDMPREITDNWECIEIDFEEQQNGVCNSVAIGNKKVVMEASAVKTAEQLSKRGYEPILVPYQTNWHTFHSGIHCSTCRVWSED
ncbi:MAG: hypothetical protein ACYTFK_06825 [Planctomycetota bacterium]|jgi:hypothetical protein